MDALDTEQTTLNDADHQSLATHGPMASKKLAELGFAECAPEWATRYRRDLCAIHPTEADRLLSDWRETL